MNNEPILFRPVLRPVCNPGDLVAVYTQGGRYRVIRVEHIEARPKMVHDFGSLAASATATTAVQLLNSSSQDKLAVAANQFLQLRFELDPRYWLTSPTTPAQMYIYQPGSAWQRWNNSYQAAFVDAVQQANYGIAMSELFSWYTDTPQFSIINDTGATMNPSTISVYGLVYTGTPLNEGGALTDEQASDIREQAKRTMAGYVLTVPASPVAVSNRINAPTF